LSDGGTFENGQQTIGNVNRLTLDDWASGRNGREGGECECVFHGDEIEGHQTSGLKSD
jgi:hypothetical protein